MTESDDELLRNLAWGMDNSTYSDRGYEATKEEIDAVARAAKTAAEHARLTQWASEAKDLFERLSKWGYAWCPSYSCCAKSVEPMLDEADRLVKRLSEAEGREMTDKQRDALAKAYDSLDAARTAAQDNDIAMAMERIKRAQDILSTTMDAAVCRDRMEFRLVSRQDGWIVKWMCDCGREYELPGIREV